MANILMFLSLLCKYVRNMCVCVSAYAHYHSICVGEHASVSARVW